MIFSSFTRSLWLRLCHTSQERVLYLLGLWGALEIGWNAMYMEMPMSHVRVKSRIFNLNYFKYSSSFGKLQDLWDMGASCWKVGY